ncbi:tonB-linked outer membrane receptor [Russula earlei]|uniref:TonB-linked outer membrane receptor n=1 Tax=Russula earlei TaxID=71964 RepID=A0ACC0TWD8_9AGAM|nr:tonB-linked outer membrane receptor [Russula earlei]
MKTVYTGLLLLLSVAYGFAQQPIIERTAGRKLQADTLQKEVSQLNEVIVTGVSGATAIRKSPVPVAVATKKEMDISVNNNIIDAIIKQVPGVSAVTTGPNISKPFIRGLGYNRVLTMYDGIRQEGQQWGDEHGIEIDQYGIERAEVVKGPASLTYGSDALAGVINMIPYVPKGDDGQFKGDAVIDYHTNNGMIGSSVGLAYKKNDWVYVFRVTGKAAHDYHNATDGYVYGTAFREYNLSGRVGVDRRWGYSHWAATVYDNQQEIPDGSRDSLTRQFTRQVYEIPFDDIKNRPVVTEAALKTYTISPLHQRIQHYRLYTHNNLHLGKGELDATLGFQQSIRREYDHPTVPEQAGLFVVLNTLNYGFTYHFPKWMGIEATTGINGMYQANASKDATDFPIPDYHLFDAGVYLFVKRSVGKVAISGGIRYDNRHIHWNDLYVRNNPATGFDQQVHLPDTIHARLPFPAFTHVYSGISGSIGAAWNISEKLLLKANIARGYRAPNITEIGSNGLDPGAHIVYLGNRSFQPEFSLQEDIGLQAWLGEADLMVELFHNTIDNYIYQAKLYDASGQPVVIVPGNTTYQYQQAKAELYGAEISCHLHPRAVSWLAFNNSLAIMEGLNRNEELLQKYGDAAKYLPFIPPLHTRSEIRTSFRGQRGFFSQWYIRAEMEYYAACNHFYGVDHTETATPGYVLFNVGCGTTILNKKKKEVIRLFLQADNLFDAVYQSNLNRLKYFEYYIASPNGRSGIYNMGRNVSMKMIVPL